MAIQDPGFHVAVVGFVNRQHAFGAYDINLKGMACQGSNNGLLRGVKCGAEGVRPLKAR